MKPKDELKKLLLNHGLGRSAYRDFSEREDAIRQQTAQEFNDIVTQEGNNGGDYWVIDKRWFKEKMQKYLKGDEE